MRVLELDGSLAEVCGAHFKVTLAGICSKVWWGIICAWQQLSRQYLGIWSVQKPPVFLPARYPLAKSFAQQFEVRKFVLWCKTFVSSIGSNCLCDISGSVEDVFDLPSPAESYMGGGTASEIEARSRSSCVQARFVL